MAKKRPQSKGGNTQQKKQKKAPTGQRPSLAPRATGVVTTGKAKRKKKDDKPPPAQGRKALVVKPARGVAVAETVQLWNVFRKKAIDEATRKKTVDAALSALTGKLYEASLKHDSARVVQALHKFGDSNQRAKIEAELVPRLGELAIRPYARHVALALVKRAADSSQRSARCRAVRGKFRQIAVHAVGAKVADALLQTAPKRDAISLRRELYAVPDADLLKAETLSGILNEVEERRRAPILLGVDATLSKLCDKGLAHYAFAHDLLFERCSSLHNLRELASRTAEAHPHFVSTRSGARASSILATAADAKTRKGLLKKCWRSRAAQASLHARAHVALIRFLDVVDDTKQTGSLISGELGPACAELALDVCGAQVLLSLLVDASSKYLSADVKDVLREDPSSVTIEGAPASRKPRAQRRGELAAHVAPGLKKALETRAPVLLASRSAAPVVIAALSVKPLIGDAELVERVARACLAPAAAFSVPDDDVEAKNPHFGGGRGAASTLPSPIVLRPKPASLTGRRPQATRTTTRTTRTPRRAPAAATRTAPAATTRKRTPTRTTPPRTRAAPSSRRATTTTAPPVMLRRRPTPPGTGASQTHQYRRRSSTTTSRIARCFHYCRPGPRGLRRPFQALRRRRAVLRDGPGRIGAL